MIDVQQLMENLFDGSGIVEGEEGRFSKVVEHLEKAQLAQETGVSVIVQLQMAEAVLAMEQVCAQTCSFDFEEVMNLLNVKTAVDQRVAETDPPEDLGEDDLARIEQSLRQLYEEDPQEAKYRASRIEDRFGYKIELEDPKEESMPPPTPQNEMPSDQKELSQPEEDEDSDESGWYDQESGT